MLSAIPQVIILAVLVLSLNWFYDFYINPKIKYRLHLRKVKIKDSLDRLIRETSAVRAVVIKIDFFNKKAILNNNKALIKRMNSSIAHEAHGSELEPMYSSWQKMELDQADVKLLQDIIKNEELRIDANSLRFSEKLRNVFRTYNITKVSLLSLLFRRKHMYYIGINYQTEPSYRDEMIAQGEVSYIKNLL